MNPAVYRAGIDAGLTKREAMTLAYYVTSEKTDDTAARMGLAPQTVKNHLRNARKRLSCPHTAAMVAKLLS